MTYCDAHFHFVQSSVWESPDDFADAFAKDGYRGCSCAHSRDEFLLQEKEVKSLGKKVRVKAAFGLHPQNPDLELAPFLERLLLEKRIDAVGESGFDFFTEEFRSDRLRQEEAWHTCLELASLYFVPLVIHDRKALDLIFRDISLLKKIPAIVFHSFAFSPREALSILRHGVNAYFSFGKAILNGNKKSIACVEELPEETLLLETDAPFQTLKGEAFTPLTDIRLVYRRASEIRSCAEGDLSILLERNFLAAFAKGQPSTSP